MFILQDPIQRGSVSVGLFGDNSNNLVHVESSILDVLVNVNDEAVGLGGALSINAVGSQASDVHWVNEDSLAGSWILVDRNLKPAVMLATLDELNLGDFVLVVELNCTVDSSCCDRKHGNSGADQHSKVTPVGISQSGDREST